MRINWS